MLNGNAICAENHGLIVEKDKKYGYCKTSLKDETLEFIKSLNLKDFELFRNPIIKTNGDFDNDNDVEGSEDDDSEDTPTRKHSSRKYICPTCPKVSFWASKEIRARCDECNELFVEPLDRNLSVKRTV